MFPSILNKNKNIVDTDKNKSKNLNIKLDNLNTKLDNLNTSLKFCSICLEELQNATIDYAITRCNHIFCTSCLLKYIKYNNNCPLCRKMLSLPNTKFKLDHSVSEIIVNRELQYYDNYIKEGIQYLINSIEYHTENNTLTYREKREVQEEIFKMFHNFGMGICLNVNTTFKKFNVFNTGSPIHRNDSVFDLSNIEQDNINLENTIVSSMDISDNATHDI